MVTLSTSSEIGELLQLRRIFVEQLPGRMNPAVSVRRAPQVLYALARSRIYLTARFREISKCCTASRTSEIARRRGTTRPWPQASASRDAAAEIWSGIHEFGRAYGAGTAEERSFRDYRVVAAFADHDRSRSTGDCGLHWSDRCLLCLGDDELLGLLLGGCLLGRRGLDRDCVVDRGRGRSDRGYRWSNC